MNKNNLVACILGFGLLFGCNDFDRKPESASGVKQISVQVMPNENGRTIEQDNVARRFVEDNRPGSIKHLYVISAFSGKVLIYSTVKGKVTSSSKRLTPTTVQARECGRATYCTVGDSVNIGGIQFYTKEVLQDDGTYGSSVQYLYWWDTNDKYHQHYVSGGEILHISDQPLAIPENEIIINMSGQK